MHRLRPESEKVTELKQLTRDQDASSLQALGGTSPVLFQSGMYSKAHRRLGCIKLLRNASQQFAWQTTQSELWARDYYQRKRAEGKSHTVAVRALASAILVSPLPLPSSRPI